jgi:ABC-type amino acid transport system permease subunit
VPFIAGLVSMTVTEAAYMAEIHRGGLLSVAKGKARPCAELQLYRHSALNYYSAGVSYFATDAD